MKIAVGSDHAGFLLKEAIRHHLMAKGYQVSDYGTFSEESADYPDYVHPLSRDVESGKHSFGIVVCGSGNGVNITANKHQGIRSALCWNTEIARLARLHNDANVLALPARFIDEASGLAIADVFLSTEFEGGRHQARVDKIRSC